jgi:hypothetical protein
MSRPEFDDTDGEQGFAPRPADNLGREDFQPLGSPIRPEKEKAKETRVSQHIVRGPDGKLRTDLP